MTENQDSTIDIPAGYDPGARCFLYRPDCPNGRIFTGTDAITAAEEDGWVDSPANVTEPEPVKAPAKAPAKKATTGGKKATGDAS